MTPGFDDIRPAIVAIDLHRGHLDAAVATMPVPPAVAARVIAANRTFFAWARRSRIKIIHLRTQYRDEAEIGTNPFWRALAAGPANPRRNAMRHNIAGMPGCSIIPELLDQERDIVVGTKKRYDCFVGTDLDFVLRAHGVNTLLVTGVNTNSCVLATVAAACSKDYLAVVVEDCVDSMDGPELHNAALLCIRTAFGFVMPSAEVMAGRLGAAAPTLSTSFAG
ncbi:MAG TPA: isochorismatase family cysteine hydrolase [Alphaproteobacteria bacterium]|nr:isochorismatase family cysteine hydrolase [Alphaproteobacteria bacterium]